MSIFSGWFGEPSGRPSTERVVHALESFLQAAGADEAHETVKQYPELLSSEADILLGSFIDAEHNPRVKGVLEDIRALLRRCAEVGVERAFDELSGEQPKMPAQFAADLQVAEAAQARYTQHGDISALDRAVTAWRHVLEHPDFPTANRVFCLATLNDSGVTFLTRYLARGQIEDLDCALLNWQQAVELTPEGSPERASCLNNLGNGLHDRYLHKGAPEDLDAAIATFLQAVELIPKGSPERASCLNSLCIGLHYRYLRRGALEDLEGAIVACREAFGLTTVGSPQRAGRLANLGICLRSRYARRGALEDLEGAIAAWRQALELTPVGSPERANYLSNLGSGLRELYARNGALEDLEAAISFFQQALELTHEGSPERANYLSNLGSGLRELYERSSALEDLEATIAAWRQAVELTPEGSPERASRLNNLGIGLRARYGRSGALEDLEAAIVAWQQAIELTSLESPARAGRLNQLGIGLKDRYDLLNNESDLQAGIDAYEQAVKAGLVTAREIALLASRNWLRWAFTRASWEEVVRAYGYAQEASRGLVQTQLLRRSKESWLKESVGVAGHAAYALAKLDKTTAAVVALERGRAQLLSEVLERNRADLEQLKALDHADLYQRYRDAAEQCESLTRLATQPGKASLSDAAWMGTLKEAQEELETTIAAIRMVPGYETFLQPSDFSAISGATARGPLVYLTATDVGGLALLVDGHNPDAVTPIWLPHLTNKTLREKLADPAGNGYFRAYYAWRVAPGDRAALSRWLAALDDTTHWLWNAVMGPLLNALPAGVTLTIIPGPLGLLPLHAAWTEDSTGPTGRRYALDQVTLRYAPNARALSSAITMASQGQTDSLLAVNEPRPVSANDLPNSSYETEIAVSTFTHSKSLSHEVATCQAVLQELPKWSVVHFSCHGAANLAQPLKSGLAMAHDQPLTLGDLLDLRLQGARLVVLSACETGIPGVELPDEVVSLPTGLLQAGFAGVIATLWSVAELSTAMLMVRFYVFWRHENLEPPEALRRAQQWLRDTTNGEKGDYFKSFLPEFAKDPTQVRKIPSTVAEAFWGKLCLEVPSTRDHAHPFHWGAFGYTGV